MSKKIGLELLKNWMNGLESSSELPSSAEKGTSTMLWPPLRVHLTINGQKPKRQNSSNSMISSVLAGLQSPSRSVTSRSWSKLRSENIAKNKFYCSLRKFIRRMNNTIRLGANKHKKKVKYSSVVRAMEAVENFQDLPESFRKQSE